MVSVLSSLNDEFDRTDARYNHLISGLNDAANAMYANATQNLQVCGEYEPSGVSACHLSNVLQM